MEDRLEKDSSSKKNQRRTIDSKKASDKDKEDNDEVNKLWDVVPTDKEQVVCCCVHGCIGQAVATWSSHLNPENKWNLCNKCQLKEMGGWADNNNDFIAEDKQEEDNNNNDNDEDDNSDNEQGEQEDENENN